MANNEMPKVNGKPTSWRNLEFSVIVSDPDQDGEGAELVEVIGAFRSFSGFGSSVEKTRTYAAGSQHYGITYGQAGFPDASMTWLRNDWLRFVARMQERFGKSVFELAFRINIKAFAGPTETYDFEFTEDSGAGAQGSAEGLESELSCIVARRYVDGVLIK